MSDSCQCGHGQHVHVGYVGGCGLCEQCTGYRLPTLAADRDDLAAILAKHRHKPIHETETFRGVRESYQIGVGCRCGWGAEGGYQEDDHRAHVAQMVLESDWLRGVRAKELRDWADELDKPPYDLWDRAAIPRLRDRADRVDAEDTDNTTDRT